VKFGVTSGPCIAMNTKKWSSLPQDVKEIFLDVMKQMPAKELEVAYAIEREALGKMEKAGVSVHKLPKGLKEDWIARTQKFSDMWLEDLKKRGLEKEGKQCWDRWQEILANLRK
jgi:TRAP-type C4-dicarboxylate transport system substrate-binding protein